MSKSVYSIVLDDDVIKMIDIAAARQNTSRSNLINRILARHISLPTTETMISDVYNSINDFLKDSSSLALQILGSGSLINMRSALSYKYNPSVKYTVEIFEKGDYLGRLKVSLRSQNRQVLAIFDDFFYLWSQLEKQYAGLDDKEFTVADGRYARLLRCTDCNDYSDYGLTIGAYVDLMDRCMKEFFSRYTLSPSRAAKSAGGIYISDITDDIHKI